MSQQKTFDKLRQLPVDEMLEKLEGVRKPPPVIWTGAVGQPRNNYYADIQYHLERVKLLEDHGWKYEDFFLELEKRSILELIKEFNDNTQFPQELIDRAKRFYPNAKFTQASIELE